MDKDMKELVKKTLNLPSKPTSNKNLEAFAMTSGPMGSQSLALLFRTCTGTPSGASDGWKRPDIQCLLGLNGSTCESSIYALRSIGPTCKVGQTTSWPSNGST